MLYYCFARSQEATDATREFCHVWKGRTILHLLGLVLWAQIRLLLPPLWSFRSGLGDSALHGNAFGQKKDEEELLRSSAASSK